MVWTIKRIEAEYFMGYRHLDIDMTKFRGITSIEGSRGAPGTSNGASKSTILEIIEWCLEGKLLRKSKKADKVMHRWMPKGAKTLARLTIDVDGVEFIPERVRTRSGTTLRAHLQGADQPADSTIEGVQGLINRTLGFQDNRTLTSTALFSGGMAQFCAMTDAERKATLERMIGADHFAAASKLALERAATFDQAAAAADTRRESLNRELDAAIAERHRSVTAIIGRATLLATQEEDLLFDVTNASAQCRKAFDALTAYHEGRVDAEREAKVAKGEQIKIRDECVATIADLRAEVSALDQQMAVVNNNISNLRKERAGLQNGTHPDKCQTCGQRWPQEHDPAHLQVALARIDKQITAEEKQRAPIDAQKQTKLQEITDQERARRHAVAVLDELNEKISDREERELLTAALGFEAKLNAAMEALSNHRDQMPDPEEGSLNVECPEIDARIAAIRAKVAKAEEEASDARYASEQMTFWRKGFGRQGLPSYLLDSSIPGMNDIVGQIASILTNGELTVSFDPAAAKGSGDIFAVNVEYANGADDYDMSSKGEHTRVDLAVMFALRDLVERRGNNRCSQLFLDEVFDGTDAAFAEACMTMLRTHYKGRDIFLISHDDAVKSLCDNTITVVKRGNEAEVLV